VPRPRVKKEVDPELVITDEEASFEQGVIAPWSSGHNIEYFGRLVQALGDALGFTLKTPWKKLTGVQQKAVLHGHPTEVHVRYRNRYGRERSYYTAYEGVIPFLERAPGGRERHEPRALRGLHARGAVRRLQGRPAQARGARR
jgi:excinuclease ABC subunit A